MIESRSPVLEGDLAGCVALNSIAAIALAGSMAMGDRGKWYLGFCMITRRQFLSTASTLPLAAAASAKLASATPPPKHIPIGLELYSVRKELAKDLMGTVRDVAKIGYECVEFYAPYFNWTADYAKEVRAQLDGLGINCYSTHNDSQSFTPEGLKKAIELNHIIGSTHVVLAHPGDVKGLDGWKRVAETLNNSIEPLKAAGMRPGYHNHEIEFKAVEGTKPIEIIGGTGKSRRHAGRCWWLPAGRGRPGGADQEPSGAGIFTALQGVLD